MTTQHTPEQLSALLDDELGYTESLTLLKRLEADPALSAKLHWYAVAKELMHSARPLLPDTGFVDRVQAALAAEPVVLAPRVVRHKVREKTATFALAASLAMLAVLVGRSITHYAPVDGGALLAQAELNAPVVSAAQDPALRDYLTMHNESAYLSGAQGLLPSIRLVSGSASR